MTLSISQYNAICNLGENIDEIYSNALSGVSTLFDIDAHIIKGKKVRLAKIKCDLENIPEADYNLRCNRLLLKCLKLIDTEKIIKKYGRDNIAVVVATTNTGVEEFSNSNNPKHPEIGNPAEFLRKHLGLKNFYTSVSTACSSGIKAFSIAQDLLNSDFAKAVIVAGVDSISRVPIFGFDSLEILSSEATNPFSKNRNGINIGEGVGIFVVEKDFENGINILGLGENTDTYHSTTPDPQAVEPINCIKEALTKANLTPQDIQYINLHGTGTAANDEMEAAAVNEIFGTNTLSSTTKPLTGHCLGAAAIIETALCCKLLENFNGHVFPHIFDGKYDENIKPIKLATKQDLIPKLTNCLCLSFGFGGTNTAIVLNKEEENV